MRKVPASRLPHEAATDEDEIDAVLAEFGGDPRAAIRALLHDLAVMAADATASTSLGYVRGRMVRLRQQGYRPKS